MGQATQCYQHLLPVLERLSENLVDVERYFSACQIFENVKESTKKYETFEISWSVWKVSDSFTYFDLLFSDSIGGYYLFSGHKL